MNWLSRSGLGEEVSGLQGSRSHLWFLQCMWACWYPKHTLDRPTTEFEVVGMTVNSTKFEAVALNWRKVLFVLDLKNGKNQIHKHNL